jgi:hypothetical protein
VPIAGYSAVESLFLRAAARACSAGKPSGGPNETRTDGDSTVNLPAPDPASECPRCRVKLLNPAGLGLCPNCGYSRSIGQRPLVRPVRLYSPLGVLELARCATSAPAWFFVLVGGMVAVLLSSLAVHRILPPTGFDRAAWSATQLGSGLLIILLAQWWALLKVAPTDDSLSALDVFAVSLRLWERAFGMMPATRWPVYLAFWGATAVASSFAITGGLFYWIEPQ